VNSGPLSILESRAHSTGGPLWSQEKGFQERMLFGPGLMTLSKGPHPLFRGWDVENQKWSQRKCGLQIQSITNLAVL